MDTIINLQSSLFTHIASFGSGTPWADPFFLALSYWFFYFVLAAVFLRIFWKIIHAKSFIEKKKFFKEGLVLIFSLLITWIVVILIKVLVSAPRPFEVIDSVRTLGLYGGGDSFPSGHTAIAAAIAGAIKPYHPRAGLLLILFALLVGISRVYLGVHFPIDVIVGFLIGLVISDIVRRVLSMF
jgi:undecaprenyl-diphosphatase